MKQSVISLELFQDKLEKEIIPKEVEILKKDMETYSLKQSQVYV